MGWKIPGDDQVLKYTGEPSSGSGAAAGVTEFRTWRRWEVDWVEAREMSSRAVIILIQENIVC